MTDFCENCGRPRVVKDQGRCLYCGELMPIGHSVGRRPLASQPTPLALFRQRLLAERSRREARIEEKRRLVPRVAALVVMGVVIVATALASKGFWRGPSDQTTKTPVARSVVGVVPASGSDGLPRMFADLQKPENAQEALTRIGAALELYARRLDRYPDALSPDLSELGRFGNMKEALAFFQGNRIQSYRRSAAPDRRVDSYLLQAIAQDQDGTLLTAAGTFSYQEAGRRAPTQ